MLFLVEVVCPYGDASMPYGRKDIGAVGVTRNLLTGTHGKGYLPPYSTPCKNT